MNIIVHIGLDKTGTSSLQNALVNATDALAKGGFVYPAVGLQDNHHIDVARALGFGSTEIDDVRATEVLSALRATVAGCSETVILSSEHFCYRAWQPQIDALRRFFADDTVTIVVYLRNQVDWLLSLYGEAIKWGNVDGFDTYANLRPRRPDYLGFLDRWSAVFGTENVRVLLYDEEGDVSQSFARNFLGGEDLFDAKTLRVNDAPPPLILEALRRVMAGLLQPDRRNAFDMLQIATERQYGVRREPVWPLPQTFLDHLPSLEENNRILAQRYLGRDIESLFAQSLESRALRYRERLLSTACVEVACAPLVALIETILGASGIGPRNRE